MLYLFFPLLADLACFELAARTSPDPAAPTRFECINEGVVVAAYEAGPSGMKLRARYLDPSAQVLELDDLDAIVTARYGGFESNGSEPR